MGALFFVWQPVIALFIGWATSENRKPVPIQASEVKSGVGPAGPQTSGGPDRRTFVVIVASLVVALSLTRIVPVRLRLAHRERAVAKMRGSRPSGVDLPLAQPMSEEEALILKQIGDYEPGHLMKTVEMVSHEKGFEKPGDMSFSAFYTKTGEPVPQPPAPGQYVWVIVQQYPNSAWAQYFAEYPPNRYNSFDNPKQHAIVVQFNSRVRSNQLERSPGQTWYPLYYIWPCGNYVITVEYHTSDENLVIVRAYLEKYPSSIP